MEAGKTVLANAAEVHKNLAVSDLIQHCVERDNCRLTENGAVVAYSGKYTGRTPKDKFTVADSESEPHIWWENNNRMTPERFESLAGVVSEYLNGKQVYVVDTYAGADPAHRISVRFIVERPYHALFINRLLIRPTQEELATFEPDWTVIDCGKRSVTAEEYPLDLLKEGTQHGDATIALNMGAKQVLILGTEYAGEMKKSIFTVMNYLLPLKGVLSMHCSANVGEGGDAALFFGLSGTGKTTLSADPDRGLIGDDEHGWTENGIFNIEGGCYAKCISLTEEKEPEIFAAIKEGAILENVVLDDAGRPNYDSSELTENTRVAYPLEHISNAVLPSVAGHPKNIIFLTCDAMGVLPPISKLTKEQAMYFFLNGYTAKVAGTEAGVTEPTAVFSTCFGAPFLPLRPKVYAELLGKKIDEHGSNVWLVNTGWTGGPAGGPVELQGSRMKLKFTRAMIHAALDGRLDNVAFETESVFGLSIPTECPDVPAEILAPRETWRDASAYDAQAKKLHDMFESNYKKFV